ncbi:TetR/AcrR family transcriptional regulator [Actinomycetospora straminea]|uniref:HTH tetR-type domain-containing protein n=1 Tax=Actinomycetospora straminea TaxID=663607 RepID=A0ABP9EFS2_9PSEU|nr:TetR/AcrR family transcriptional regulator [Actinomycetospora straminea]MDD7934351.1 TetR/AcrR family transcriptional regulator [Actinomycetospora straminea]
MGKRAYDSPLRSTQATRTRESIVEAARRAFVRDGYGGTSMASLAREAGVSRETLYKIFRTKPDLLKAVYDVAVVGDHEAVAVAERSEYTRMLADPDPEAAARTFGVLSAELVERIGPVLRVLAEAAHEPELQELLEATRAERLEGTRDLLVRLSGTAEGPALDRAVDVVWTLISPEVALLLTDQRGWTREQYGRWLGDCVAEQVKQLR